MSTSDVIGTAEAAEVLKVDRSTVSRWIERGLLNPLGRLAETGPIVLDREEVEALKRRIDDEGFPRRWAKAAS